MCKILRWRPKCSQASGDNMSTSCLLQCHPSFSLLYCSLIKTHLTTKKGNLILTEPTVQARCPACYGGWGFLGHGDTQLCSSISVFMYHGLTKAPPPTSKRANIKQLSPLTFLYLCLVVRLKSHGCMFWPSTGNSLGKKKKIRQWIKIEFEQPSATRPPRPSQCIFMLKGGSTLLIFSPFCTGFLCLGGDLTNHPFWRSSTVKECDARRGEPWLRFPALLQVHGEAPEGWLAEETAAGFSQELASALLCAERKHPDPTQRWQGDCSPGEL